jgi:hypothetical protein
MDVFAASAPIGLAGAGWYATERSPDGTCFRWVADGAWLDVAQLSGLMYEITLDIEPGPAVGLVEFDLAVYEDGTTWLATVTVPGRTRVAFRLAAGEARVRHLELRPQNTKDAVVVPLDPRSLRYRVFEVGVTAVPDVNHLEEQIVAGAATIADLSARVAELSSTWNRPTPAIASKQTNCAVPSMAGPPNWRTLAPWPTSDSP